MTRTQRFPLGVTGLHHVTAIASNPQRNLDFYTRTLGLRFVKRTVNFDDPGAYHLYYGDETGSAGGVMTFFAWPDGRAGRAGAGQVAVTQFAIPEGAGDFWRRRLAAHGVTASAEESPFGDRSLRLRDPDGVDLALVETADPRAPWTTPDIGADVAIRGFHGVTLRLRDGAATRRLLCDAFGYDQTETAESVQRLRLAGAAAGVVDLQIDPAAPMGGDGAGVVHHVAFSVPDDATQAAVRQRLIDAGQHVTPQIDRDYFNAIYTRSPDGVLIEVATETPGFAVDEPVETLGQALRLPRQHAHLRERIEAVLPPLST